MNIPSYRMDGSVCDMTSIRADDIVWREIAETLGKTNRWGGRHPGNPFSVAQHSVMGADALYEETGSRHLAAQFVLHDVHEHWLGDIQTPVAHHLDRCAVAAGVVRNAIATAKSTLDLVIFEKAGVELPLAPAMRDMDARMCRAEAIYLFGRDAARHAPAGHLPPPRLVEDMKPWGWAKAAERWLEAFDRYVGRRV